MGWEGGGCGWECSCLLHITGPCHVGCLREYVLHMQPIFRRTCFQIESLGLRYQEHRSL